MSSENGDTTEQEQEQEQEQDLVKACKAYIPCDAGGCQLISPKRHCSKCQMVFYCSRSCQANHSYAHQSECLDISTMRASIAGIGSGPLAQLEADPATIEQVLGDQPACAICLEEDMTNPIVLADCKHAFCFACLKHWNDYQTKVVGTFGSNALVRNNTAHSTPTCPTCRQAIPNVSQTLLQNALLHMAVAKKDAMSPEERTKHCDLAMAEIQKVLDIDDDNNNNNDNNNDDDNKTGLQQQQVQADVIRVEIAILVKDFALALEIIQGVALQLEAAVALNAQIEELMHQSDRLRHDERNDAQVEIILNKVESILRTEKMYTKPTTHVMNLLKVGEVQRLMKDWEGAKMTYQDLFGRYPEPSQMTPPQQREIFTSMSQCAFELQNYDMAISLGEGALEMNRYYPGSHKYVVLAYQAKGELESAQKVAAEAVVYETPWDDRHRQQIQEWYRTQSFS